MVTSSLNPVEDNAGGGLGEVWDRVPPTRDGLRRLRSRAMRCGVWFRWLRWSERRYLDAVIRVVDVMRSPLLLRVVGTILKRVLDHLRGGAGDIAYLMRTVGRSLARVVSRIAFGWGYGAALRWQEDQGFIQYLTVMHVNVPRAFA